MIALLLLGCGPKEPVVESCTACAGECLAEQIPESTRDHVADPITYADAPPTNGDHNPCWAAWGAHADEVPDENWVHNLEHGGVVFLYQCPDGCPEEQAELTEWTATLPAGRWILSPYSEMSWRFAAVSWNHRLQADCLDIEAFQAFYDQNVGNAPEDTTSDPSESCM